MPVQPSTLWPRQWQVLALAAKGLTNPQIASTLGLSAKTVGHMLSKNWRDPRSIYARIDAANRAEAAAWYERHCAVAEPRHPDDFLHDIDARLAMAQDALDAGIPIQVAQWLP